MKRAILIITSFLVLSGCTARYNYEPTSDSDPKIIFGDRFGEAISGPSRTLKVNTSSSNNCPDYKSVGKVSKWGGFNVKKTRSFHVPPDTPIYLTGRLEMSGRNHIAFCDVGPFIFLPESNKTYSVDIHTKQGMCGLSIVEISETGDYIKSGALRIPAPQCKPQSIFKRLKKE